MALKDIAVMLSVHKRIINWIMKIAMCAVGIGFVHMFPAVLTSEAGLMLGLMSIVEGLSLLLSKMFRSAVGLPGAILSF
jgi:hypothetical protein